MVHLKYFRIYSAVGVYDPLPDMDVTLLNNDNVVVRLLGSKVYASILDELLTSLGKRISDLDGNDLKKVQPTRDSYLLYGSSNAILYISSSQPLADINVSEIQDEDGPNLEKLPHKAKADRAFGVVATAISLSRYSAISKDYEFVLDGYYAIDEKSGGFKKLHHHKRSRGKKMSKIDQEEIQSAILLAEILNADKELQTVIDLFSRSLKPYEDGFLQAFISAWTGLEIFIAKQFKAIQLTIGITIKGEPAHDIFSKRMLEVMKDKYRLLDKFAALSNYLNESGADEDITVFKKVKQIRDEFFHNMVGPVESLPLNETRELLEKYLKLYLVNEKKIIGLSIKKSGT